MTACTNHGGKARRVVTAALVGVLSVGTVPMVALATGTADDGIQTLAADWTTGAKVIAATDGKGATLSGDLMKQTFTVGSGKYLVPSMLENSMGDKTEVNTDDYVYSYYKGSTFNLVASSEGAPEYASKYFADDTKATVDVYYLVISNAKDATEATDPIPFRIVSDSKVEGVQVKGSLVYNGTDQRSDIKFVDGEGNDIAVTGVTYTKADGTSAATVKDAGDYVAKFTYDGQTYNVPFTVAKLDLAEASITVPDDDDTFVNNAYFLGKVIVNGKQNAGSYLEVTKVVNPSGASSINGGRGMYEVTLSGQAGNDNVTGTATISCCVLTSNVAEHGTVYYGSKPTGYIYISLADGETFDASKISLVGTDGKTYKGEQVELSYYDTINHKAVDASALSNKGIYEVTIRVKPVQDFATSAWYGGTRTVTVNVVPVKNTTDNLGFYLDGEIAGATESVTYDGTDQLERVSVVIKNAEGDTLVEGTDYEVVATDADGKAVDSIVNAGTYEITVKPLTFEFTGTVEDTLELTVNPVKLTTVIASVNDMKVDADKYGKIDASSANEFYVPFTGAAVEVPGVKYEVKSGGSYSYVDLDSSLYNIVSVKKGGKTVTEAKDKGTYTVKIALSDAAAGNYTLTDTEFNFTVREYGYFIDVDPAAWYAQAVEQAYRNWYVNGIGGTNLFSPGAEITRADVACILYNMAGGDRVFVDTDFSYNEWVGYITGFEDVDGHAYYAKAIAWAKASGVVNGHGGNFRPNDKVTREEFATMLANFAKSKGESIATDGSALAALPDASSVSAWAQESVAWAVENDVMGNGGFVGAQTNISRAEVAAMAVNYQPEPIVEIKDNSRA